MGILKKPIAVSGNGSPHPPDCGEWGSSWPALAEFLSSVVWEDGTPRQTGTLMFLTDLGVWKLWLHDRHSSLSVFVSAPTPEEALRRAEMGLKDSSLEWRSDRPSGQRLKR